MNSFEIAFAKVWLEICDDVSLIASDSRVNGIERQSLAALYELSAESRPRSKIAHALYASPHPRT